MTTRKKTTKAAPAVPEAPAAPLAPPTEAELEEAHGRLLAHVCAGLRAPTCGAAFLAIASKVLSAEIERQQRRGRPAEALASAAAALAAQPLADPGYDDADETAPTVTRAPIPAGLQAAAESLVALVNPDDDGRD